MGYIKGQNLRLFIKGDGGTGTLQCVAAATSCALHTAATTEDASTKDDTGDWGVTEVTGFAWDCSCDSLLVFEDEAGTANAIKDIWEVYNSKKAVDIAVQSAGGEKNREAGSGKKFTGKAIITDLSIQAQNKQNTTLSIQLQGVGELALA